MRRLIPYTPIVLLLLGCLPAAAHTANIAMERAPAGTMILYYIGLGIEHIVPGGLDHILFVVALCLLNNRLKTILWQATAFTLAHSITLALSAKGVINLPPALVEPLIALSIVFVAVENVMVRELKFWRIGVVFLFGLIHGMGFAAALDEIGLPRNRFLTSIISFNLGVELGQLLVIAFVYALLIRPFGKQRNYRKWAVNPLSLAIGLIAAYWTVTRMIEM
jgi:uncharacterized membrane protein